MAQIQTTPDERHQINFTKLSQRPQESNTTLLFGPAKTGKTSFAATAGTRSLIIDNGNGLETLISPWRRKQFPDYNPIIVHIPTEALDSIPRSFDMIGDAIDNALEQISDDFDTVILDDSSAFKLSAAFKAAETNQTLGLSKSMVNVKKYNILLPVVQDFKTEMNFVHQFLVGTVDLLKNRNKNFIVLAHERVTYEAEEDNQGKRIIGGELTPKIFRPAFTGVDKNPDQIAGLFDWVLHSEVVRNGDNRIFRIRTAGDSNMLAEMRGTIKGMFPEVISNPDYLKMLDVYRKGGVYPK